MPSYNFSIINATGPKGYNFNSMTKSVYHTDEEYHAEGVNVSLSALGYVERFLDVIGLSSTQLSALSAAVNSLDGLGVYNPNTYQLPASSLPF